MFAVLQFPAGAGAHSHDKAGRPHATVHTAAATQLGSMSGEECKGEEERGKHREDRGLRKSRDASVSPMEWSEAVKAAEATVAFDATGGGTLEMHIMKAFDTTLCQLYPDQVHPVCKPAYTQLTVRLEYKERSHQEILWRVVLFFGEWT